MTPEQKLTLKATIDAIQGAMFPADITASSIGLVGDDYGGLPIIKTMYAAMCGSLDAAKSLHDALLPGFGYRLSHKGASVYHDDDAARFDGCTPNNPARSWLLAILEANVYLGMKRGAK